MKWTTMAMGEIGRRLANLHYRNDDAAVLDELETYPPAVAAYIAAYILGTIPGAWKREVWMNTLASRATDHERSDYADNQEVPG